MRDAFIRLAGELTREEMDGLAGVLLRELGYGNGTREYAFSDSAPFPMERGGFEAEYMERAERKDGVFSMLGRVMRGVLSCGSGAAEAVRLGRTGSESFPGGGESLRAAFRERAGSELYRPAVPPRERAAPDVGFELEREVHASAPERQEDAERLSGIMERDSRRYDAGFARY